MEAAARAASELRGSTTLREARATIFLTTNLPTYYLTHSRTWQTNRAYYSHYPADYTYLMTTSSLTD